MRSKPKKMTKSQAVKKLKDHVLKNAIGEDVTSFYDQYAEIKGFWPRFKHGEKVIFTKSKSQPDLLGTVVQVSVWRSYEKSDKHGEYPIDVFYTYTVEIDASQAGSYQGPMKLKVQDHQIKQAPKDD